MVIVASESHDVQLNLRDFDFEQDLLLDLVVYPDPKGSYINNLNSTYGLQGFTNLGSNTSEDVQLESGTDLTDLSELDRIFNSLRDKQSVKKDDEIKSKKLKNFITSKRVTKKLVKFKNGVSSANVLKVSKLLTGTDIKNYPELIANIDPQGHTVWTIPDSYDPTKPFDPEANPFYESIEGQEPPLDEWDSWFKSKLWDFGQYLFENEAYTKTTAALEGFASWSNDYLGQDNAFGALSGALAGIAGKAKNAFSKDGINQIAQEAGLTIAGHSRGPRKFKLLVLKKSTLAKLNKGLRKTAYTPFKAKSELKRPKVISELHELLFTQDAQLQYFVAFFSKVGTDGTTSQISADEFNYAYYFYTDKFKFKPVKKVQTTVNYGAFKTQVALNTPEGTTEFSFEVSQDLELTLWRIITKLGLGISEAGVSSNLATSLVENTYTNLHLVLPCESTIGTEGDPKVLVNHFILEDVKFSNINELPFAHNGAQLKSQVKGICSKIYLYHRQDLDTLLKWLH